MYYRNKNGEKIDVKENYVKENFEFSKSKTIAIKITVAIAVFIISYKLVGLFKIDYNLERYLIIIIPLVLGIISAIVV